MKKQGKWLEELTLYGMIFVKPVLAFGKWLDLLRFNGICELKIP
jgi:hypothetical protein